MQTQDRLAEVFHVFVCLFLFATMANASPDQKKNLPGPNVASSSAVGWGNLIVPGLGASLRDRPVQGFTEAGLSISTFYSGTLLAPESRFKIDGTVPVPEDGQVGRAVSARILQQFGLKYHFYNTFHHYQRAVYENEATEAEKRKEMLQPVYRGTWKDMFAAPFRWKNISSPWTWPVLTGVTAFLIYDYSQAKVTRRRVPVSGSSEWALGTYNLAIMPMGSSFGEDVLFRGFMQREVHGMTGSLPVAIGTQSLLFSLLHSDHFTSFLVGAYFGVEAHALKGELGPMMAAHFWLDLVIGLVDYWQLRRASGKSAPLSPPIATQIQIPF